jgi:hypothetical protein
MKNIGYKFNEWYDVAFLRLDLNPLHDRHESIISIQEIGPVKLDGIFNEAVK